MSEESTIPPQTRELILERVRRDVSFVVATHENPDGDALGSLIGMHGLLTALGKESEMFIAPSDLPLPREYRCAALEHAIQAAPADIGERTIVMLDCGNIDRNPAAVLQHGAHLLNIDHHHDNTMFGTLNLVDPTASCTAEIVWDLMHGLDVVPSTAMAEALYVGLVTDTGRFMYENTGPRAHRMAAELISAGVDVAAVYRRLYEEMPLAKLTLLGVALERIQRFDSGELTLAALDAEDFGRAQAEESFSEGIVDHLRCIEGTKVAVLIRELTAPESRGKRKVSLRATDDDADVSLIARTQGGGGHRRAAGFSTTLAVAELIVFLRGEIAAQLHPAPNGSPVPTLA
jgi:phosphoesterase RecJ-like protein